MKYIIKSNYVWKLTIVNLDRASLECDRRESMGRTSQWETGQQTNDHKNEHSTFRYVQSFTFSKTEKSRKATTSRVHLYSQILNESQTE